MFTCNNWFKFRMRILLYRIHFNRFHFLQSPSKNTSLSIIFGDSICILFAMLGDSIFPLPIPQDKYAEDRRIWNTLFEMAITDLAAAEKDGIPLPGSHDRFFPIVLGNKGDWSYLATCLLHI